jgi:hypothetical protein
MPAQRRRVGHVGPNVDDIIEKAKQLRRLDGLLWSSLDFKIRGRYIADLRGWLAMPIGRDI